MSDQVKSTKGSGSSECTTHRADNASRPATVPTREQMYQFLKERSLELQSGNQSQKS